MAEISPSIELAMKLPKGCGVVGGRFARGHGILGLAERENDDPLQVEKIFEGCFRVINAYDGKYDYFQDDTAAATTERNNENGR